MVISWKKNIPFSEILLNSLSSVWSRVSLRSARAPLMLLYIKYGTASVLGISTVFVGKWRDLHFCSDEQQNQIREQHLNANATNLTNSYLLLASFTNICKNKIYSANSLWLEAAVKLGGKKATLPKDCSDRSEKHFLRCIRIVSDGC